jgi:hypothetical protein
MLNDRYKQTAAHALTDLPPAIHELIAALSGRHSVDLNSVEKIGDTLFRIGEPRTGNTIIASKSHARMERPIPELSFP